MVPAVPITLEAAAMVATPAAIEAQPVIVAPLGVDAPSVVLAAANIDLPPPPDALASVDPLAAIPLAPTIQKAIAGSGLIMVETSRNQDQGSPQQSSPIAASRPLRRKRASVVVPDEPLVMIETRK